MPVPCPLRVIAVLCLLSLAGCIQKPAQENVIGLAYAGPAALNLHKDIDSKSDTVTIAHHGDKLDIVGQRRRWYKVRTAKGIEGWTSDKELLDTGQMSRLKALASETAGMPSQGVATTFGTLNVHTEPSRQSPSFVQMNEKERVDVIAHKVAVRATATPKRELVRPRPKIEKKKGKKDEKALKVPLPPSPPPPAPPSDWLTLSKTGQVPPPETETPVQGPLDDWTLIRTENGTSGWVLTSGLYLMIPDEVAQYAEGHRITSYFSIGKIADGGEMKDIWLWTTSIGLGEEDDFDGYRVFVWSLRHHRYETAYIQRRERGFFPVIAKTGEFSVCLERDDGSRVRKQYVMMGNSVRPAADKPCERTPQQVNSTSPQELVRAGAPDTPLPRLPKKSFTDGIRDRVRGLFGK